MNNIKFDTIDATIKARLIAECPIQFDQAGLDAAIEHRKAEYKAGYKTISLQENPKDMSQGVIVLYHDTRKNYFLTIQQLLKDGYTINEELTVRAFVKGRDMWFTKPQSMVMRDCKTITKYLTEGAQAKHQQLIEQWCVNKYESVLKAKKAIEEREAAEKARQAQEALDSELVALLEGV